MQGRAGREKDSCAGNGLVCCCVVVATDRKGIDMHLTLATLALLASIVALIYAVHTKRGMANPLAMSGADRVCAAWNNEYSVGAWIAFEPQPFDEVAARLAACTLGKPTLRMEPPSLMSSDSERSS